MNKLMRKFVATVLSVLLTFTGIPSYALAEAVDSVNVITPEDYLFYTVSEQGVVIDYYDGNFSEFTIPDIIAGENVIEIGSGAFANLDESFCVEIPATIRTIAEDAFADSPNVEFRVTQDSFAKTYAQEKGIRYSIIQTSDDIFDCSAFIGNWELVCASVFGNEGTAENLGITANLSIVDDTYMEIDIDGQITGYALEVINNELVAYDGEEKRILSINEKGNLIVYDDLDYLEFERNTDSIEKTTDTEETGSDKAENALMDNTSIDGYIGEWELGYVEQDGVAIDANDADMHGTLIIKDDGSGEMIREDNSITFSWQIQNDCVYIPNLKVELHLDDQGNLRVDSLVFVKDNSVSSFYQFYIGDSKIDNSEMDGLSETLPAYGIVDIAVGSYHSVGLRKDGTVIATGSNSEGECDTESWRDVVQVEAGDGYTVGLTSKGELLIAGDAPTLKCNENIRSISSFGRHIAAVKLDGTVVTSSDIVLSGNDYVQVSATANFLVALRNDGTVVAAGDSDFKHYNYYNECSVDDWKNIVQVAAGDFCTIGLCADGSVVATGYNENGQCEVAGWKNIVSIAARDNFSIGVDVNGFVHVAAYIKCDALKEIEKWTDIASVAVNNTHVLGLKTDGTVVASSINWFGNHVFDKDKVNINGLKSVKTAIVANGVIAVLKRDGSVEVLGDTKGIFDAVSEWSNIKQIDMNRKNEGLLVGLTKDGRVLMEGKIRWNETDATDWTDIDQIAVGSNMIVGLKRDGTVVAVGRNDVGECDVENWSNICQIAAGNIVLGLKKDGTVLSTLSADHADSWTNISRVEQYEYKSIGISESGKLIGLVEKYSDAAEWNDIVQVDVTIDHMAALKSDGTVLAIGDNDYGQCNTDSWSDIVWISTDWNVTVGVKADGSVIATSSKDKCDVQTWGVIN